MTIKNVADRSASRIWTLTRKAVRTSRDDNLVDKQAREEQDDQNNESSEEVMPALLFRVHA
jgi:hypothetical protein